MAYYPSEEGQGRVLCLLGGLGRRFDGIGRGSIEMFDDILLQFCGFFDPVIALNGGELFCLSLTQFGDIAFVADQVWREEDEQIEFLGLFALKPEEPA